MNTNDQRMSDDLATLFLELGKALFICQSFEESLCFLHALMSHEEVSEEQGAFEASWDFHSTKTLGQLINALRKRIDIPDDLSAFLEAGLKIRNGIVHGFVPKNMQRLVHPKERAEVENELEHMKREVKKRDVVINKLLDAMFAKYGMSNTDLKHRAEQQWVYANEAAAGPTQ